MTAPRTRPTALRASVISATILAACGAMASHAPAAVCPSFSLGVDTFSAVQVTGTSCANARRLIAQATLTRNRGGARVWGYAGWRWRMTSIDEMGALLAARRGPNTIRAVWGRS